MNSETWQALQQRAIWLLGHADQAPPRKPLEGMALQLRLWRFDASGMHVSWSLIVPVREYKIRKSIVREASWDSSRARRRPEAVEPEIRIRDAEFEWSTLSPFLEKAGGLRPGLAEPDAAMAAAGPARSGLEGSRAFAHVRLAWAGRGPRAGAATIAWFERFRKLLARPFREKGPG